jgi:hypothetical protein
MLATFGGLDEPGAAAAGETVAVAPPAAAAAVRPAAAPAVVAPVPEMVPAADEPATAEVQ